MSGEIIRAVAVLAALAAGASTGASTGTQAHHTGGKAGPSWQARRLHLQREWGIDIVGIRPVSSGLMLRFDYRVVDPARAAALTDHSARPYLIDERTQTALAVPAMENVGELRQAAPLQQDRTYFMIFGNPGRLVKRGSRVSVVVGRFRADGLLVD